MAVLYWILYFWGEPTWAGLNPEVFETHDLHHIASPTSLLRVGEDMFLGADHLAARPGLYRLSFGRESGYRAGLLKILPQQVVEGLQRMENGDLMVVSERKFSARPEDWVGQFITLDPEQYRLTGRTELPEPDNRCSNKTRECGLADIAFLSETRVLAFTKKGPAKVYLMNRDGAAWSVQKSVPIFCERKAVTISEVKQINGEIICLLKNRWMLASFQPEQLLAGGSWKLDLKPVFDFSAIRKKFGLEDLTFYYYGLAEGFEFDVSGNLMVLLNNRGYAFRKSPDGKPGLLPKLLLFPRQVNDRDRTGQIPENR